MKFDNSKNKNSNIDYELNMIIRGYARKDNLP